MDERKKPIQHQTPMQGPRGGHGMSGAFERPKNTRKTLLRLLMYLNKKKWFLLLAFILMIVSSFSMLAGNYFLKPLINNYILPGDFAGLGRALMGLGAIYLIGVGASYSQSRLMVQIAQKTTNTIRQDLFVKMQKLPVKYFDTHSHGDVMSRFTNDLDNVHMALEQSILQLMSSVLIFLGSVIMMLVLSPLLSVITFLVLGLMFFPDRENRREKQDVFSATTEKFGQREWLYRRDGGWT